jgi:hypothetical protein
MATAKRKRKTFYASVHVTRIEEWCVEAASADEARALLAQGDGERRQVGECLHLEIQSVSD